MAAEAAKLVLAFSAILREKGAALRGRGIEINIGSIDSGDIVKARSIPLLGASLLGLLGAIELGFNAAEKGYQLYAKPKKSKS